MGIYDGTGSGGGEVDDGGEIVIGTGWTCAQLKSFWGSTHNDTYKSLYNAKGCVTTDGSIDGAGGTMGCAGPSGGLGGLGGLGINDACSSY